MKPEEFKRLLKEFAVVTKENSAEQQNYMFFQNLHTIKRMVEKMMEMNPEQVDNLLSSGHAWAVDHIATSTDDVSEVATWLCNELDEELPTNLQK